MTNIEFYFIRDKFCSIANSADFCPNLDGNAAKQEIGAGESTVTYSYSVEWIEVTADNAYIQ